MSIRQGQHSPPLRASRYVYEYSPAARNAQSRCAWTKVQAQKNQPLSPMFITQTSLLFSAALIICIPSVLAQHGNQSHGQNPLREISIKTGLTCRPTSSFAIDLPIHSRYPRTVAGSWQLQTLPRYFDQPTPEIHLYGLGSATAVPLPPAVDNASVHKGHGLGTRRIATSDCTNFSADNQPMP